MGNGAGVIFPKPVEGAIIALREGDPSVRSEILLVFKPACCARPLAS